VAIEAIADQRYAAELEALRAAVPQDHVDFLRRCVLSHTEGDYVFVHAGSEPGQPWNSGSTDLCGYATVLSSRRSPARLCSRPYLCMRRRIWATASTSISVCQRQATPVLRGSRHFDDGSANGCSTFTRDRSRNRIFGWKEAILESIDVQWRNETRERNRRNRRVALA
jgi:hypothetical protein